MNHPYSLKDQIAKLANGITCRHYKSQPLPSSYSKHRAFWADAPCPSQMQEAFMKAVCNPA